MMPLLRLCLLILIFPHAGLTATITQERGPTGDKTVSFIVPEPDFTDTLVLGSDKTGRRHEDTGDFRRQNVDFNQRGLTPDGAGDAFSEVGHFGHGTFLKGRVYRLDGIIQAGDTDRLSRMAEPHLRTLCPSGKNCPYSAVLSLNSAGGSFAEAIRLARFIRKWSLVTVVDKGDRCESACALTFLSAYNSFAGYSAPRRFAHLEARIGIHQPAVEFDPSDPRVKSATPDDLFRLANLAAGEVTSLFLQTGVSIGALDRMYATPPNDMMIMSPFQLIDEKIRVFDDQPSVFSGGRSDLIALCANRFAARHYTQSDEVISNFMMRENAFLTFDAGRNFLCAGNRSETGEWEIETCLEYEGCGYIGFVRWATEHDRRGDRDEEFGRLSHWLLERGFLGFREFAHQSILLRVQRDHDSGWTDASKPMQVPASAIPMPLELCGKLDEAHPALVLTVQQRLATYGFDTGGADGSLGPKSRKAVQAANAQIAPDDPPNNRITKNLLKALRIDQPIIDRYTLCHASYRN